VSSFCRYAYAAANGAAVLCAIKFVVDLRGRVWREGKEEGERGGEREGIGKEGEGRPQVEASELRMGAHRDLLFSCVL